MGTTTATPASFATRARASVLGPGTVSASAKKAWSSFWQKYGVRYISGRHTTSAPSCAASRTFAAAFSTFSSGRADMAIWTRPTWNCGLPGMATCPLPG